MPSSNGSGNSGAGGPTVAQVTVPTARQAFDSSRFADPPAAGDNARAQVSATQGLLACGTQPGQGYCPAMPATAELVRYTDLAYGGAKTPTTTARLVWLYTWSNVPESMGGGISLSSPTSSTGNIHCTARAVVDAISGTFLYTWENGCV